MDELMNRQNTIKEIKSTIIIGFVWVVGIIIFGLIHFDLMYLIINVLLFIFTIFAFLPACVCNNYPFIQNILHIRTPPATRVGRNRVN